MFQLLSLLNQEAPGDMLLVSEAIMMLGVLEEPSVVASRILDLKRLMQSFCTLDQSQGLIDLVLGTSSFAFPTILANPQYLVRFTVKPQNSLEHAFLLQSKLFLKKHKQKYALQL